MQRKGRNDRKGSISVNIVTRRRRKRSRRRRRKR